MVRLVDVAKAANVSVATVSRTLNGHLSVDAALAARVRAAATELGYRPNVVARNLRRRGTTVWALVLTDITNPFYTALARGVEDVASRNGYSVLLGNSDEDAAKERRYLAAALEEQVAGIVLASRYADTDLSAALGAETPVVAVNQRLQAPVDSVVADSYGGARRATEHLIGHGRRVIACITGPADADTAQVRAAGHRDAMADHGLPPLIQHTTYDAAGGLAATGELLDSGSGIDAIFAANATIALGVVEALQERRVRLGTDVAMVCFDDAPWARIVDPPMTVVAQQPYEIGTEAAKLLLGRIRAEGPSMPVSLQLTTQLITRRSCGCPGSD
ncbi:MAG: LacI family transcriptional regulator [Propionibacteriales bacterium]|nr:LacI family transcriptional regulator [Propionibacteriales bacterium]